MTVHSIVYVGHPSMVQGTANTESLASRTFSLALPNDLDRSELDPSAANEPQQMKHPRTGSAKNPTTASF